MKQIPPSVIIKVHHLSQQLQAGEINRQVVVKHMVEDEIEDEAHHGVGDQVQDEVEDKPHHRVEDQVQDGIEGTVHQYREHQQRLIQIVPFQKLQEPGRWWRTTKYL